MSEGNHSRRFFVLNVFVWFYSVKYNGLRTHPGIHVSVSSRHFIPYVIPVVFADLPRHVTAPGIGPWATTHRVPIIVHSICSKHDDTLTASSCASLKQFKSQLERLSVKSMNARKQVKTRKQVSEENDSKSTLFSHCLWWRQYRLVFTGIYA